MRRKILCAVAGASLLIAPTFVRAEERTPTPGGTLVFGAEGDLTTLNPFLEGRSTNNYLRTLVYEGLTARQKDMSVVPGLASSWTISRDGLSYTFRLRPKVRFHHGKELEAADVKWSYDTILNPRTGAYMYSNLKDISSTEVIDPLTVRIRLATPMVSILSTISTARVPVLPAGTVMTADVFPPGTGPFQGLSWKQGSEITFKKFPAYWNERIPHLDQVIVRPIRDEAVRATALRSGDIHIAASLASEFAARVLRGEIRGIAIATAPGSANGYLRLQLNLRAPPFQDLRVRQAVVHAIDKEELCSGISWGLGQPASQRYPKGTVWHLPVEDIKPDLAKARVLLKEAGYPSGLRIATPAHSPELIKATTILKAQLARVGVELEIQSMDFASRQRLTSERRFSLLVGGEGLLPDPDTAFSRYYHSQSRNNNTGFSNAEVDRWIEVGRRTLDLQERRALYLKVLQVLMAEVPEVPLCQSPEFFGLSPQVLGFSIDIGGGEYVYAGGGLSHTWLKR